MHVCKKIYSYSSLKATKYWVTTIQKQKNKSYSSDGSSSITSGCSSNSSATGEIGRGGMTCLGTDPCAQQSVSAASGSVMKISI